MRKHEMTQSAAQCLRLRWMPRLSVIGLLLFTVLSAQAQEPRERPLSRTVPGRETVPSQRERGTTPARPSSSTNESRPAEHPLKPAIRLAEACLETLEDIEDYTALLSTREYVNGTIVVHTMAMKFREEPFSVYFKFGGEHAGREVLYVEGQNQNMLLAHEGSGLKSLVGTVSLSPESPEILKENRHTITDAGLRNMVNHMITRWEEESRYGECEVKYYPKAKLNDSECLVIECRHPTPHRQFKFHISRLFIDRETNLPMRVENYAFPRQGGKPMLVEEYTYSEIKTNVGLTDADFDRKNPRYAF
ncbi:MAG: DUF1571 domain-containing protein [Planctomycetota bacterium]|nr:MAG: DUF1571 domain-containing protein [Planctomycetota bacterium]REK28935.1 MAG: DUF1571 domain-containing protein [Planctomycetota bacterium]REK39631.1 MAG: DUF1571 domain-containing protein [Planctomycetota bacterium]